MVFFLFKYIMVFCIFIGREESSDCVYGDNCCNNDYCNYRCKLLIKFGFMVLDVRLEIIDICVFF